MSIKFGINSKGEAYLEIENTVPTEAEKKTIDELIAPDGFVMAQVFKKLKVLGEYIEDSKAPAVTQSAPVRKEEVAPSKPKFGLCPNPKCARHSVVDRVVKKEGINKGKTFKVCLNKDCGWKDLSSLQRQGE